MITELTPEILADLQTPQDVRISQCGNYVVWALRSFWTRKENVVSSLWMADVGKEHSARQLTLGNYNDESPGFSPDGRYISFLSDRAKPGKTSALYLLPLKGGGGEAMPLTSTEFESSVECYAWSPDSTSIAFTSADEKSEEKKKKIEAKDDPKVYGEDWPYSRLRLVSVESKKVETLVSEDEHIVDMAWSPEHDKIAFRSCKTPQFDDCFMHDNLVRIVDIKDKKVTNVCTFPSAVSDLNWHEKELLWIAYEGKDMSGSVYSIDVTVEDQHYKRVAYGLDSCARGLKQCAGGVSVYVQAGLDDRIELLNAKMLYEEDHKLYAWDVSMQGNTVTLAVIKGSVNTPNEVFSVTEGKPCQLSNHHKDFSSLNLGTATSYQHTADDGVPLDGVLCIPDSLENTPGPHKTVVLVHGGPYDRTSHGFDHLYFNWSPWLLSLGYVLLCPNYRGGSSHGSAYASAVVKNAAASYDDIIALVKKGVADRIIDEKRVAVAGWSQGGFLSYLSVTRDSTLHFSAAICGAGISDWSTMAMTSDVPSYEALISGPPPWMMSDDVSETQARLSSPIYHMQDIRTPVLILHGENDERVPVTQAIGFHRGMMARGKECEMVIYPREGHGHPVPLERAHYIDKLERLKRFLEKHLR